MVEWNVGLNLPPCGATVCDKYTSIKLVLLQFILFTCIPWVIDPPAASDVNRLHMEKSPSKSKAPECMKMSTLYLNANKVKLQFYLGLSKLLLCWLYWTSGLMGLCHRLHFEKKLKTKTFSWDSSIREFVYSRNSRKLKHREYYQIYSIWLRWERTKCSWGENQ